MLTENRYSTFCTMNYTFVPSLEHRALVRTAITLWNQDDVTDLVSKFGFSPSTRFVSEKQREFGEVGGGVIKKVLKLPLPELLKKELSSFVGAVGWQILIWRECHKNLLSTCSLNENLSNLCWTPQGIVDRKKTAEVLVGNESLDITRRYKLACTYCLEDDIYTLWEQLSGTERHGKDLRMIGRRESALVSFWCDYIEGKMTQLENTRYYSSEYAFVCSAFSANKTATRYFLQKLSPEQKKRILVTTVGALVSRHAYLQKNLPCDYSDILCFLLSTMDTEQQIEIFKSFPHKVLELFLQWPWQSLFMEMAKHMWSFLHEDEYGTLLCSIVNKIITGYKDYDYRELLGEFWQQSPTINKIYVIDECCTSGTLLTNLFRIRDEKNIKLILSDATLIQKEKLILKKGQDICQDLICGDKWDLLQFFIQECKSSKTEMIKFKEEFKEYITLCLSKKQFAEMTDKWDKFCQLLDDLIENSDKRKLAEDDHPAKKFCNIECEKVTQKTSRNMPKAMSKAKHMQKKKLILCFKGQDNCQNLIYDDKYDLHKFFIQECITLKNEMIKFKEVLKRLYTLYFKSFTPYIAIQQFPDRKDKWDELFQLLNDFIENSDKTYRS